MSPSQQLAQAVLQAKQIGKQTAIKADGLQNHTWGRSYLAELYRNNPACKDAAQQAYESQLQSLSGEASA